MRSVLRAALHSRIVVHTRDGQSLRGVLTRVGSDALVLAGGEHLAEDGVIKLEGDQIVLRGNVSFIQRLGVEA